MNSTPREEPCARESVPMHVGEGADKAEEDDFLHLSSSEHTEPSGKEEEEEEEGEVEEEVEEEEGGEKVVMVQQQQQQQQQHPMPPSVPFVRSQRGHSTPTDGNDNGGSSNSCGDHTQSTLRVVRTEATGEEADACLVVTTEHGTYVVRPHAACAAIGLLDQRKA